MTLDGILDVEAHVTPTNHTLSGTEGQLQYSYPHMISYHFNQPKKFQVDMETVNRLQLMRIPHMQYVEMNENVADKFIIATAVDKRFLGNVLKSISTLQEFHSGRRIIVYDLGNGAAPDVALVSLLSVSL